MILIDTSVWIAVLRNRSGEADRLQNQLAGQEPVPARFTQLELLQGARDETEWGLHQDRDFETIARIRPLSQIRFDRPI